MTSDVIIRVEGLAKQYRLGEVSTGTLAHDVNRWWHRVRGKEDPYLRVTQKNLRNLRPGVAPRDSGDSSLASTRPASSDDYVWALRDINFDVRRGEVLGIVGRNGAGKSTLLKLMSRITAPSAGVIKLGGRIAALLEVGTGFHQDLTGRENVYLNGAILGMTKAEITRKLDEIVEFSGCARYLDTPVKRYSSGMTVRLGFAVAAHLEPDILIVDEVLAVGDAEFQQKCIGKMRDVAGRGRTVLFVSHNLEAIRSLTDRCLVLADGEVRADAPTEDALHAYMLSGENAGLVGAPRPIDQVAFERRMTIDPGACFDSLGLAPGARPEIPSGGTLALAVGIRTQGPLDRLTFGYTVRHESGLAVCSGYSPMFAVREPGLASILLQIEQLDLSPGLYDLHLSVNRGGPGDGVHNYEILFGVSAFRVNAIRAEGGALPPWNSKLGHVIHRHASVHPG